MYMPRQPSTSAVQSAEMPRPFAHHMKSVIRLVRQSTTVPNTSKTSALTAERSDAVVMLGFADFPRPGWLCLGRRALKHDPFHATIAIVRHIKHVQDELVGRPQPVGVQAHLPWPSVLHMYCLRTPASPMRKL